MRRGAGSRVAQALTAAADWETGELPPDADVVLDDGLSELQNLMRGLHLR